MDIVTEVWKDVPGTNGGYQASSEGRIRSTGKSFIVPKRSKPTILKPQIYKSGYARVSIFVNGIRKRYFVHRLVMYAFYGIDCDRDVNHKNGYRHDNRLSNLEYMTKAQNTRHSFLVLNRKAVNTNPSRGENHPMSKLKERDILEIRKSEYPSRALAKIYSVHPCTIQRIKSRKIWKNL